MTTHMAIGRSALSGAEIMGKGRRALTVKNVGRKQEAGIAIPLGHDLPIR